MSSALRTLGVDAGVVHQRLQPGALGMAQPFEPVLQQVAGVVDLFGHIGDDAQRHQIEIFFGFARPVGQFVEALHQLVGNPHAGQCAQRIAQTLKLGVDDGIGAAHAGLAGGGILGAGRIDAQFAVGKFGRQIMVIGDDDGETGILGQPHTLGVGDAGVAAQEYLRRKAGVGQIFAEFGDANAMAFCEAVGHMEAHLLVCAQIAQGGDEQRRAGLAIDVKIAPDQDVLSLGEGGVEDVGGAFQPDQRRRRRRCVLVDVEEGQRLGRCIEAALGQQHRHQGVSPDGSAQLLAWFNGWEEKPGAGQDQASCSCQFTTSSNVNCLCANR